MKAGLKILVVMAALLCGSLVFYSFPSRCEGSVMEQLCSSVTSFLDDEADKAGDALKGCKANCGWKKRKNDLIIDAQKKAKSSCAKGEAPDINELNKGLDANAKTKLKNLYNQNSQLFDGKAKLPDKDFEPVPSKQTAALTGKGGLVADLKASGPDIPKLNQTSEFSLAKPSSILASGKIDPSTISKTPTVPSCPGGQVYISSCTCPFEDKNLGGMCQNDCYAAIANQCGLGGGVGGWDKFVAGVKKYWEDVKTVFSNLPLLGKIQWASIKTVIANLPLLAKILGQAALQTAWAGIKWPFEKIGDAFGWVYDKIADALSKADDCNGNKYNPNRLCCTKKGPMIRSGIKNLADCAQRYSVGTPAEDGCHVGLKLNMQAALNSGDFDHPLGMNGPNFRPVCNSHIWCYFGNCSWNDDVKHKTSCDAKYLKEINDLCNTAGNLKQQCREVRDAYYNKIAVENGPKSYESSQKSNCSCCAKGAK